MRFAFVSISGFNWGGSEILWVKTAKVALQQGNDVLVSVYDWSNQHPEIVELRELGARFIFRRIYYPNIFTRIKKKVLNLFLVKGRKYTYHQYLSLFKPDHIIFNLAGGDEIAADPTDLMVFIRQTKIPFSIIYHSLSPNHVYSEKVKLNFIYLVNKSKINFYTSQMQIDLMRKQLGYYVKNCEIICHPLRPLKVLRNYEVISIPIQFSIIGSLVKRWKGQDIVIRILSKPKWENRDWILNIYGEGEDLNFLKELAKAYSIEHKVIFHGFESDVNKIFSSNHIVLIPSQQDSGPIVLFEAMLAGKPIVATYMGAMPDYIEHKINGVIAKDTSENEFDLAMEIAWENRDHWKAWGRIGQIKLKYTYDFSPEVTLLKKISI